MTEKEKIITIEKLRGIEIKLKPEVNIYFSTINGETIQAKDLWSIRRAIEEGLAEQVEGFALMPDLMWDLHRVRLLRKKPDANHLTRFNFYVKDVCEHCFSRGKEEWVGQRDLCKFNAETEAVLKRFIELDNKVNELHDEMESLTAKLRKEHRL